jgi:hypothetical protein
MKSYVITAYSTPDYDSWGPDDYWGVPEWIKWHKLLVEAYGLSEANRIFLKAYHAASFGAASYAWRSTSKEFRDYAKANGFYDGLFEGLGGWLARINAALGSIFETTSETVESAGSAITNSTTVIRYLLPALIIMAVVAVGYYLFKRFIK